VKVVILGVATTVQELITEHESVARQLSDGVVQVPPMNRDEMLDIFRRAEKLLDNTYWFNAEAKDGIISVASGHPFYVHLIGKHALLRAIESKRTEVTRADAEEALKEVALKGSAPIQEKLYKDAIGHSYPREYILKAFARVEQEKIHTTELYQKLGRELGVEPNLISVYVGHLASEKYGAVLERRPASGTTGSGTACSKRMQRLVQCS
jgi:hypothetical protein